MVKFLEFGFPIGVSHTVLTSQDYNHSSVDKFAPDIYHYLATEVTHDAIYGPYRDLPIDGLHTSPMFSRPKPSSEHR